MKKLIVYVAASGNRCFGYSNWIKPTGFTTKIEEADLVLGLGGSDVGCQYYNQPDHGNHLYDQPQLDKHEYADFKQAIEMGKPILGICKGAQWMAAMAGGAIFQHISHPSPHLVTTYDGKELLVNSLHHNLQDVSNLKEGSDYKMLAWADNLSPFHYNGYNQNIRCEKEPEIVFYPKIKALGFQHHPEMVLHRPGFEETNLWCKDIFQKFMENKL